MCTHDYQEFLISITQPRHWYLVEQHFSVCAKRALLFLLPVCHGVGRSTVHPCRIAVKGPECFAPTSGVRLITDRHLSPGTLGGMPFWFFHKEEEHRIYSQVLVLRIHVTLVKSLELYRFTFSMSIRKSCSWLTHLPL